MKTGKKLLSLLLLAVFVISTGWLVWNFFSYRSGGDTYSDARQMAQQSATEPTETQPPMTAPETLPPEEPEPVWMPVPIEGDDPNLESLKELDLKALRQVNEDVLGWIQIPGTKVDYPILQGEDNEFYLEHDWEKKEQYVGSIFLECRNSPDFTDFNTIIYGHNMSNGSMFGTLWKYAYGENWKDSPYVYLVADGEVLRYEVFSTYEAEVDSPTYGLSFQQWSTRADFLTMALENSDIDTGIIPDLTDRIITLSTCSGMGYTIRRVVHARLPMELTVQD